MSREKIFLRIFKSNTDANRIGIKSLVVNILSHLRMKLMHII